jgi:hypothetical protein
MERDMTSEYKPVIDWLLAVAEPWVVYNTLIDLAGADPDSRQARAAYRVLQKHPRVTELIDALDPWPPAKPLSGAYDPKDSIWKLNALADFGLRRDDKRIAAIANRVFAARADDGGFLHGGFDHTQSWHTRPYICISHVMTYALARFGNWPRGSAWTAAGIPTSSTCPVACARPNRAARLER